MATPEIRILVDLNIVLDVISKRKPHLPDSALVWYLVETGQVTGFLAAHSITTLFYLTRKQIGHQQATAVLQKTLQTFSISSVNEQVIHQALSWGWQDFEDAVQMATAVHTQLDYLITRNPKDFETHPIPVLQPAQLVAILK